MLVVIRYCVCLLVVRVLDSCWGYWGWFVIVLVWWYWWCRLGNCGCGWWGRLLVLIMLVWLLWWCRLCVLVGGWYCFVVWDWVYLVEGWVFSVFLMVFVMILGRDCDCLLVVLLLVWCLCGSVSFGYGYCVCCCRFCDCYIVCGFC